jgi:hypothetical protein
MQARRIGVADGRGQKFRAAVSRLPGDPETGRAEAAPSIVLVSRNALPDAVSRLKRRYNPNLFRFPTIPRSDARFSRFFPSGSQGHGIGHR